MAAVQRDPNNPVLYGITWVTNWLTTGTNAPTMLAARNLQGGWEAWLQVVLALNGPTAGLAPGYTVRREQRNVLQDPTQRIDVFMQRPEGVVTPSFGIELKCRTVGETSQAFVNRLIKDMEKIQMETATGLGLTNLYAIGITTDADDRNGYAEINGQVHGKTKVYYWNVSDGAGGQIYVVWLGLQYDT